MIRWIKLLKTKSWVKRCAGTPNHSRGLTFSPTDPYFPTSQRDHSVWVNLVLTAKTDMRNGLVRLLCLLDFRGRYPMIGCVFEHISHQSIDSQLLHSIFFHVALFFWFLKIMGLPSGLCDIFLKIILLSIRSLLKYKLEQMI